MREGTDSGTVDLYTLLSDNFRTNSGSRTDDAGCVRWSGKTNFINLFRGKYRNPSFREGGGFK